MVNVVVLGASPNSGQLREVSSAPAEALIQIGSKAMVAYVLEALLAAKSVAKIVLVGPEQELAFLTSSRVTVIKGGLTAVESLRNGLKVLPEASRVLVAAADIPLLTPEAIDGFINQCSQGEGDVFYPIVAKETVEQNYPGIKRTYVQFREGIFTGGNLFLINPLIVEPCAVKAQEMVQLRKSPLKLAKLLGFSFIVKFLMKRLSLPEVEQKVSRLLQIKGRAIITHYAEIGADVDKPSDYHIINQLLTAKV